MAATFGRHRQSIADIENQLHEIFNQHPNTHFNDNNEPVIPGDDLVEVLHAFSDAYNGLQLLNDDEAEKLKALIQSNPGLEVTPSILIAFIAEKTKHTSPTPVSPGSDFEEDDTVHPSQAGDQSYMHPDELRPPSRTRSRSHSYHPEHDDGGSSSDSNSNGGSFHRGWSNSQSDGPPNTPRTASGIKSPFDNERRQRSTPLSAAAPPSSWAKRPAPARRRKSMDAGSRSDSESSFSISTSSRTSSRTRTRAPSNPTSPAASSPWSPNSSFTFPRPPSAASISRPGSRAGSRSGSRMGYRYDEDDDHTIDAGKSPFRSHGGSGYDYEGDDSFDGGNSISARGRMGRRNRDGDDSHDGRPESPRSHHSDDEDDHSDDEGYILHHQRDMTTSDASMQSIDRVEALTRTNAELGRKLMEAERTLSNKLSEHEMELEEMQGKLEEMRTELSATKREEKELRSKERQNNTQIAALEAEIAKVTKALESARSTYASLQRQYQEQCAVSERYRDDLRQREELIRNLREASALHDLEAAKWQKEQEVFESRISSLEESLTIADAAHGQLEEQKQENLLLKETIDRMRFDMDELRNSAASNNVTASGMTSQKGSMSKSLGAELAGKMNFRGDDGEGERDPGEEDEEGEVESQLGNLSMDSSTTTVVDESAEDTESEEDVIQTIITRKKKKVASRANQSQLLTQTVFEETKEYSDSSTQYDLTYFFKSHSQQTDPEPKILTASFSVQTEPEPVAETGVVAIQTEQEPEPVVVVPERMEMKIQTEPLDEEEEEEEERSPSPQEQDEQPESMASSSSTIIPPTPKAHQSLLDPSSHLHPDAPPSYNQVSAQEQEEKELRALAESLRKWHAGVNLKVPLEGVPGGISEELVEEWKKLQKELGVGCGVIDRVVESSRRLGSSSRKQKEKGGSWFPFINVHNKFYFGGTTASNSIALWVGASALMLLAVSPYVAPQQYSGVPGGPTYYDRSAWSSFNSLHASGEGFSGDGTKAVWQFLGRVGGGAARIARGWPT